MAEINTHHTRLMVSACHVMWPVQGLLVKVFDKILGHILVLGRVSVVVLVHVLNILLLILLNNILFPASVKINMSLGRVACS